MRINYDLKKDLEDIQIDDSILQRKLNFNKKKYYDLCDLMNKSIVFDDKIVFILSDLMSYYEGVAYTPFVYSKTNVFFRGYMEELFVGIAPEDNVINYIDGDTGVVGDNIEKFFQQKRGIEVFKLGTNTIGLESEDRIVEFYKFSEDENDKKVVAFPFILDRYNIKYSYPFTITINNFDDFEYVQDFISYLFEIQLKNGGKMLDYNDMIKAMDDYLELEAGYTKNLVK